MPALAYYRANEGAWSGPFELRVTDPARLRAERGRIDTFAWRLLGWLPGLRMHTTVAVLSSTEVRHTTRLRWGSLTLMAGGESLRLDGGTATLVGESRTILGQRARVTATATVSPDAMRAIYDLVWLGMAVRQTGTRAEDGVVLRQWGPGFESEVALQRDRSGRGGSPAA